MKGYNHGKPITEETRRKMSEAAKRTLNGYKKGHPTYLKNHSEETKQKLSEIALKDGRRPYQPKGYNHSEETRKKLSESHKGLPNYWKGKDRSYLFTPEYRLNMSVAMKKLVASGKHNFWKGGVTPINKLIRSSVELKLWREAIFKRDKWTCQECKVVGGELNAHHIKPFSLFPELRFAIDNGVTLCRKCHEKTDTFGRGTLLRQQLLASIK